MNLKTAVEHVLLATGGNPSTAIATENERIAQIINDSANYLYSMPWRWREVHGHKLTLGANTNYVELPADFSELVAIKSNDGSGGITVAETTPQHIEELIGSSSSTSSVDYVAVVFNQGDQSTVDVVGTLAGAAPKQFLKVFPQVTSEDADRYRISYRRGFGLVNASSSYTGSVSGSTVTDSLVSNAVSTGSNTDNQATTWEFQFPYYLDPLYVQYLRAFALGYEQGQLSEQLLQIEAGPIYQRMISRDGLIQNTYGKLNLNVPPSFPIPAQNTVPNPS